MRTVLIVIERAYTGCVEEQYAHILWMCHSYNKAGGAVVMLLQGTAALYARREQAPVSLTVGGIPLPNLHDYSPSVEALVADGNGVYVLRPDLDRLQIAACELHSGVQAIEQADLARIFASVDAVCYW